MKCSAVDASLHRHAEHSFGVTRQRAQQQAALSVTYADRAVVGADQQDPTGAFLCCTQTAHPAQAVTLKHIQLLQSLMKEKRKW